MDEAVTMTNTLEQRAEFVATLQEMLDQDYPAAGHDCLPQFSAERAALTAAIAALRLSAPPEKVVLWSRNVSPHWFFVAKLADRPPMDGSPVYETMDPVVLQGSPEAMRLSAGADWVLPCDVRVPPATTINRGCKLSTLIHALELSAETGVTCFPEKAAAPRHEPGEVKSDPAWNCRACDQLNSGWANECGRCGERHAAFTADIP